jgi:glutamate-5-semialdehyde dehydrogenase
VDVVNDSKVQYVAVCNATETLLVHKDIAEVFLPVLKAKTDESNVQLKGCERTRAIIPVEAATEKDWKTEYLDYILSIKVVDSLEEAIEHVNTYGSGHTDSIITNNRAHAERFMDMVDSGNVFWNCSTRFSDGYKYGFGAEVGISTNKIHARGPMGLEGLLIYKFKLVGNGHIVSDYAEHRRTLRHRPLDEE